MLENLVNLATVTKWEGLNRGSIITSLLSGFGVIEDYHVRPGTEPTVRETHTSPPRRINDSPAAAGALAWRAGYWSRLFWEKIRMSM